ncbi:MAG TPA: hypothetical protein VLG16_05030 [Candidatus Saccharimonadales bacterium]|nr:hypothetical protein [Candidatus Saccharimonadales bacterium]
MPAEPNPHFERLRELSTEHGGYNTIPADALSEIGYVRVEEEDGLVRVLPAAKLALEQTVAQESEELIANRQTPFEPLSLPVKVSSGYATSMRVEQFEEAAERCFELSEDGGWDRADWLPKDHQMNNFLERFSLRAPVKVVDAKTGEESFGVLQPDTGAILLSAYSSVVAKALNAHYKFTFGEYLAADGPDMDTLFDRFTRDKASSVYQLDDRFTNADAELFWGFLERVKAQLTDIAEVDTYFTQRWTHAGIVLPGSTVAASDRVKDLAVVVKHEGDEFEAEPAYIFGLQLTALQKQLASKGFADVADQLQNCTSVAEIRAALQGSLGNTQVETAFKQQERALKDQRRTMQSEEDIHEFNRQYQALKDARKAALRPLRGACDYLNLPTLFAKAARHKINELQQNLVVNADEEEVQVRLDPRFNERDMRHGEVSGDYTIDEPLPFGTKIPAFNVKIEIGDQYVGNIYLLETTADSDESFEALGPGQAKSKLKVWHFDAIQWPSFAVDWDAFPQTLVDALAPHAEQKNIDLITINKESHQISNYDYIAKAFLKYLGATNVNDIHYSPELWDDSGIDPNTTATSVYLDFPPQIEGYHQFQGDGESQLVLWKNPNITS